MKTSLSAEEIADDLAEDDITLIQKIMDTAKGFAPEYDIDAIYEKMENRKIRITLNHSIFEW